VAVAVVGSGPSGLAAAFRLQQAGYSVRLFEAGDYVGGKLRTAHREGFVIDEGAGIMPAGYRHLLGMVEDAGLAGEVIPAGSVFGFARDGAVHHLDADRILRDAAGTRLLSARSKLAITKLLVDALRLRKTMASEDLSAAAAYDTETAGDYARRRLTPEIHEYVTDVIVRGLIGAPADLVSKVDLIYSVTKFIGAHFVAFPQGMGWLPGQLAGRFQVELGSPVVAVEEAADEVLVTWSTAGMERAERFAGCVLAIPAGATAAVLPRLDDWRASFLRAARYTKMVNASIALTRPPANERAMYVQVPRLTHPGLIGIALDHNKAPGRVPPGKGLLGLYCLSSWSEELIGEDDDLVVKQLVEAAERVLPGIGDDVEFATVSRWDPMVLEARPGYWKQLAEFNAIRGAKDRLVQLAGDYFCSSNLNSAAAAGQRAATDLVAALSGARDAQR
jgi:oxygen-dependent protoporphyrinogen oxidase